MDEAIKKLTDAIEKVYEPQTGHGHAIEWLVMDLAAFLTLPSDRHLDGIGDGLAGYRDAWIRWKAQQ